MLGHHIHMIIIFLDDCLQITRLLLQSSMDPDVLHVNVAGFIAEALADRDTRRSGGISHDLSLCLQSKVSLLGHDGKRLRSYFGNRI